MEKVSGGKAGEDRPCDIVYEILLKLLAVTHPAIPNWSVQYGPVGMHTCSIITSTSQRHRRD